MANGNIFISKSKATLLVVIWVLFLLAFPSYAQKVVDKKVWTTYHKSPVAVLTPKYSSYSIEYDFGDMVVPVNDRPTLPGQEYKKADGDLVLKITVKSVYGADKEIKQETIGGRPKVYYNIAYKADYGYSLIERVSGTSVASYKRNGGLHRTEAFSSKTELDIYLKNAFVADLTKDLIRKVHQHLIRKVHQRIEYDLAQNKFEVRLVANYIDGNAPACQEINQATKDFITSITTLKVDKDKLRPTAEAWEGFLKKANWEDKKSEINKKVANALIENLCAAYLLLEDYDKLASVTELSQNKNKGLLSELTAPTFDIEPKYSGPSSTYHTLLRDGKMVNYYKPKYIEFVADLTGKY